MNDERETRNHQALITDNNCKRKENNIMKATLKNSKANMGKWSRRIGGAALALTLAGPLAPATTSAEINEMDTIGHEVIEVEGQAPSPLPTAPWGPGGYTGGGSGSSGGPSGGGGGGGGGGGVPSGGGSGKKPTKKQRIEGAKASCVLMEGTWSPAIFNDIDTNVELAGYVCSYRINNKYNWWYYDSEGFLNQHCSSDTSQDVICTADQH
jgi:hypothetical protein